MRVCRSACASAVFAFTSMSLSGQSSSPADTQMPTVRGQSLPVSPPQDENASEKSTGGHLEFEVAAIHLGKPEEFKPPLFPLSPDNSYRETGGRFFADFPLNVYIEFAYKLWLTSEQRTAMLAHLPKWVSTDAYVIEARAPGNPTKDQMRLMVQSLLRNRFKLAVHFENHVSPVLVLVLDSRRGTGLKLRPHSDGPPCDPGGLSGPKAVEKQNDAFPPVCDVFMLESTSDGKMKLGSRNTTLDLLAESLPSLGRLGRPVVDRTGLSDRYDFTLEWNPEPDSAMSTDSQRQSDLPQTTFLEALHDQLGLKLRADKAPVRFIVIDHIEQPSPN